MQPGSGSAAILLRLRNILLAVLVVTFSGLLFGGWWIYKNRAPLPRDIVTATGATFTTLERIQHGQDLFRSSNLMDFGSILGHGAYLGPDFTAQALKLWTLAAQDNLARTRLGQDFQSLPTSQRQALAAEVVAAFKTNGYDAAADRIVLAAPLAAGADAARKHYVQYLRTGDLRRALPPGVFASASDDDLAAVAEFLIWTSWLSVTPRPGDTVTYTNNWPYAPESGNTMSPASIIWSAVSVVGLIGGLALVLLLYSWLGGENDSERPARWILERELTPSQRRLGKYFLVSSLLLVLQTLFGGLMAHDYVTGSDFYGLPLGSLIPFQLARGWHLQLAIFWIATAWIGIGLFLAPVLSGKEPRGQAAGVDVLFWALVVLVLGSMTGLFFTIHGKLGAAWYWLGTTGWEYLELGRIWQVVLAVGLTLWLILMARGLGSALRAEGENGDMARLYLATSVAIPFFYLFAFVIQRGTHITVADYWRWWIIHLWVEGIFEVFAVVVTGTLLVRMGLTTQSQALRSLYLQLLLLLGSGVLGTGHHYYWIGAPEAWIAVGSVFSALEVIPLTLLLVEAASYYKRSKQAEHRGPYQETFLFLASTAFWNLVGAGLLGFLINLPAVSYFEHGTFLTATHGHGAMMGVFGFLAIAVMLFGMRHLVTEEAWPGHLFRLSFYGLNLGLAGMIAMTLLPVGFGQLYESMVSGFDAARSTAFYDKSWVHTLLWLRMIPDSIFIVLGAVPLAAGLFLCWRSTLGPPRTEAS
ncbi:MAG: cbb3-type cytochrome c oxidase subunit I [Candidatus Wallbacteria bacterium]|nr:cbb3-type cytochrome c oxidase subunit I [Candidatus Wallbacteria bacterium]